jgi:hypothetical protein
MLQIITDCEIDVALAGGLPAESLSRRREAMPVGSRKELRG